MLLVLQSNMLWCLLNHNARRNFSESHIGAQLNLNRFAQVEKSLPCFRSEEISQKPTHFIFWGLKKMISKRAHGEEINTIGVSRQGRTSKTHFLIFLEKLV